MPTKILNSQTGNKGIQSANKFGGGSNTIIAIDDGTSDYGYIMDGGGGDDSITGSDHIFDGLSDNGTILDQRTLNGDLLIGGDGSDVIVGGLGDDWIYGGAEDGSDGGKGKSPAVKNDLYGDFSNLVLATGESVSGFADHIFGGDGVDNSMYGDNFGTLSMGANSSFTGGNDEIKGGDGLAGEFVNNVMVGDSQNVFGSSGNSFTGGDDTLIGGSGINVSNQMIGDALSLSSVVSIKGGDDTLISGTQADDIMTGDWGGAPAGAEGGADTFVFGVNNGRDIITDFRSSDGDKVDVSALGIVDFDGLDGFWMNVSGSQALDLDGTPDGFGDMIVFQNIAFSADPDLIAGLGATDFIYA